VKKKSVRFLAGVAPTKTANKNKTYTLADLKKKSDGRRVVLIAIDGNVCDVAGFLNEHPGGEEVLLKHAGTDASAVFKQVGHSSDARALMKRYRIGRLSSGLISNPILAFVSYFLIFTGFISIAWFLTRKRY
jgi:cytochrome b involved in lipid metabolism